MDPGHEEEAPTIDVTIDVTPWVNRAFYTGLVVGSVATFIVTTVVQLLVVT